MVTLKLRREAFGEEGKTSRSLYLHLLSSAMISKLNSIGLKLAELINTDDGLLMRFEYNQVELEVTLSEIGISCGGLIEPELKPLQLGFRAVSFEAGRNSLRELVESIAQALYSMEKDNVTRRLPYLSSPISQREVELEKELRCSDYRRELSRVYLMAPSRYMSLPTYQPDPSRFCMYALRLLERLMHELIEL